MRRVVFLIIILCAFSVGCSSADDIPAEAPVGRLRVRVMDGASSLPLCGAEVVIPEINGRYSTNEFGLTDEISVPVICDSEYERLLPSGIGRATVIVFAEGMTPCMLLYVRIDPETDREPIPVLMFPDDGTLSVFTMIEAPSSEWSEELAELYR